MTPAPRLMAIGDVHGRADLLDELLDTLRPEPTDQVVFLGDLIDYGPNARATLDRVEALRDQCQVHTLLGNHELMLLDYVRGTRRWTPTAVRYEEKGGYATLADLGIDAKSGQCGAPPVLRRLWAASTFWLHRDRVLFVHAGLGDHGWGQTTVAGALAADPYDLVWDRSSAGRQHKLGVLVVHGHTVAAESPELDDQSPWTLGLDTGTAFGGPLSAAVIDPASGSITATFQTGRGGCAKPDSARGSAQLNTGERS